MKWGRKRKESQILSHVEDDKEPKASQSIMKTNPWFCQYHHLFPNYSRNESAITVKISSRLLDILVTQHLSILLAVTVRNECKCQTQLSTLFNCQLTVWICSGPLFLQDRPILVLGRIYSKVCFHSTVQRQQHKFSLILFSLVLLLNSVLYLVCAI